MTSDRNILIKQGNQDVRTSILHLYITSPGSLSPIFTKLVKDLYLSLHSSESHHLHFQLLPQLPPPSPKLKSSKNPISHVESKLLSFILKISYVFFLLQLKKFLIWNFCCRRQNMGKRRLLCGKRKKNSSN